MTMPGTRAPIYAPNRLIDAFAHEWRITVRTEEASRWRVAVNRALGLPDDATDAVRGGAAFASGRRADELAASYQYAFQLLEPTAGVTMTIRAAELAPHHVGHLIDADVPDTDHVHGRIEQYTVSAGHIVVRWRVTDYHGPDAEPQDIDSEQEFRHDDLIQVTAVSPDTAPPPLVIPWPADRKGLC